MNKHTENFKRSQGTKLLPCSKKLPLDSEKEVLLNFKKNIGLIRQRLQFLIKEVTVSEMLKEFLRSEVSILSSSVDKYMFEILKVGLYQILNNTRASSKKFESIEIKMKLAMKIHNNPENEDWLSECIVEYYGNTSFQNFDKIKEITNTLANKKEGIMGTVSKKISMTTTAVKNKFEEIFKRRHQIVHKLDTPIYSTEKDSIDSIKVTEYIDFIEKFITALHSELIL